MNGPTHSFHKGRRPRTPVLTREQSKQQVLINWRSGFICRGCGATSIPSTHMLYAKCERRALRRRPRTASLRPLLRFSSKSLLPRMRLLDSNPRRCVQSLPSIATKDSLRSAPLMPSGSMARFEVSYLFASQARIAFMNNSKSSRDIEWLVPCSNCTSNPPACSSTASCGVTKGLGAPSAASASAQPGRGGGRQALLQRVALRHRIPGSRTRQQRILTRKPRFAVQGESYEHFIRTH